MDRMKILAVDDDPIVLDVLCDSLIDAGYQVVRATDGQQAIEILDAAPDDFDAVVLDWMMPGMDGIDVLRSLTADTRFVALPVIMQTSQDKDVQIQEAIQAGAYYYIIKPYKVEALRGVIQAASAKYRQFREGMSWGIEATAGLALLRSGVFEIRTRAEAHMVANLLADLAERPAPVISGLLELLTNAIENGNLGIDHREKTRLIANDQWDEEFKRRLFMPENLDKVVTITFSVADAQVAVDIKDCGVGFDWRPYLTIDNSRTYEPHGRGIAMAKAFSFDTVEYSDGGTRVRVTYAAG